MSQRAIVIGAGLGGLATALRLQQQGWQVTVFEKNSRPGGRCSVWNQDGFQFDMGPTLLLMRDVLDDLFASLGRRTEDYLDLVRVHPNYRVHFGDGTSLEFSNDFARMAADLEQFEPGAGSALGRYLDDAGYKYRVARERFVERNFPHWHSFVTPRNLYYLLTTRTLRKLDRHARRYFRDERLGAAFTFQTMYLGLAPHDAPSVYSLLPYTELVEGIWFPRGGMYRLVEALVQVAGEMGVDVRTETEVTALTVQNGTVRGVYLAGAACVEADAVVVNADLPYAYRSLVPPEHVSSLHRLRLDRLNVGSSAFLMYLGVDREYPELNHHDVFLSRDVRGNFDAIFKDHVLPDDPSFYVCTASRTDRSLAPPGGEALYVLVPVPSVSPRVDWPAERDRFRDRVYRRLETVIPDIRQHVVLERIYTPDDFVSDYNLYGGAAFGISHSFLQVGYMRPSNRAPGLENLYFVGASTQPGGGIPMVFIGSRLTAERIEADRVGA